MPGPGKTNAGAGTGSVGTTDTEGDGVTERARVTVDAKNRKRIARDRAVVPGAIQRVIDGAVFSQQPNGAVEIIVLDLAFGQRALPEGALLVVTTAKTQDHRQGDFALSEVVANRLAKAGAVAGVVKRIVDQLKRHAEIAAVRLERGVLFVGPAANGSPHLGGGREQGGGLGIDDRQIRVLGGGGLLGGRQLHNLAFGDHRGGV